jgi:Glycosyl transferase family 64 domain
VVPDVASSTTILIRNSDTLRQSVCSWGSILAAPGWRDFLSWIDEKGNDFDPMLKDSPSNRWPVSTSWKKLALRFAAERKMYMYYPLFPEGETLVRKVDLRGGTNDKGSMPDKFSELVVTNRDLTLPPDALSVPRLDYKLEPVTSDFASFDGCTLVMPICHRLGTVQMLLEHYASVPFKAQIILVHQPCVGSNQSINVPDRIKDVPIVLKRMPSNDMNNRYLNFDEIMYDCIINIDDDVMHPLESMHQLVRLWKAHFFDYYVGWTPQGRIHVIENNKYAYKNQSWVGRFDGISSMLLPSGSVYHRKFLDAYNSEPNRPARKVVSRVLNCDDVLMNFVIANATNRGPVLIDDWNSMNRSTTLKALSEDTVRAQWKKTDHMKKRAECLSEFSNIYGRMPLRYSTVLYKYDKSVERYPVRVSRKSTTCYLFSSLVPHRNTMHDAADLCDNIRINPFYRNMTCKANSVSS